MAARIYTCPICAYEYDPATGAPQNGIPPGTPFEDLPDNWHCPECGASTDQFEPTARHVQLRDGE